MPAEFDRSAAFESLARYCTFVELEITGPEDDEVVLFKKALDEILAAAERAAREECAKVLTDLADEKEKEVEGWGDYPSIVAEQQEIKLLRRMARELLAASPAARTGGG